ncbi:PaaX domain-containing protein, C- domain protein [Actinocorallia aurea]
MEFRPLTARSVVLSTLLGAHPPRLAARHLVRVGELFGVAEGTVRVALSRMVAAGDLVQTERGYALADRLVERQRRQDDGREPRTVAWEGSWEMLVVVAERRGAADRAALREDLAGLGLAELREGVWTRPANLARPLPEFPACLRLDATVPDPVALAARLWDLPAWDTRARALNAAFEEAADLRARFVISAAALRHLRDDPLLPPALLPQPWPGPTLRAHYAGFREDLAAFLRTASTA